MQNLVRRVLETRLKEILDRTPDLAVKWPNSKTARRGALPRVAPTIQYGESKIPTVGRPWTEEMPGRLVVQIFTRDKGGFEQVRAIAEPLSRAFRGQLALFPATSSSEPGVGGRQQFESNDLNHIIDGWVALYEPQLQSVGKRNQAEMQHNWWIRWKADVTVYNQADESLIGDDLPRKDVLRYIDGRILVDMKTNVAMKRIKDLDPEEATGNALAGAINGQPLTNLNTGNPLHNLNTGNPLHNLN